MKPWNYPSLRVRLTWRMVAMQALVLIAFTSVVAIPIVELIRQEQGLDDGVIEHIADSIQRTAAGDLEVVLNEDMIEKSADFPRFWFYAIDIDGHSAQMGNIPAGVADLLEDLPRLNSANIADIGLSEAPTAIVRRENRDDGTLWIITGGGPEVGFKALFATFGDSLFLGLLFLLTLVSFLVIPMVVTRQLRGVAHVAAEADRIDVDQRGIRLSSAHVPEELHSLVGAVNSALQRLDDGMERRQRFLADAAHELRTPIAILQTRIELLPADEQRSRLLLDVARLANLANQLLDLQRLDADLTVFQPVNLVDLAAQVTADMAPLAIAAGDEISFDAEVDNVTIAGDAASLSRAIVNLIQNAVIHGGSETAIRVGVGRDGSLRVADTGPGIAEEHRQTIFEPFNRVVPLDQGAGLGLNLVRDIIARHHGQITVGDAPGGGALFEISLPVASPAT
ncbi:HAMP domain-containing histidine kinase [Devosia neptuniae]|uniref:histidine kinase n=1 Tax=Devosia neptuniae TaxID=191302 RepID=A0ABY6C8L7_9HYPH|nr:HAMP domain-containing sensor histidine kinase [Devosia neptuniae]UXN68504.1 HAMP domain-containing histidine kinase [Devosia neptuniae]